MQQQALALEQQFLERTQALEAQIVALERARAADQTTAEQGMVSEELREGGPRSTRVPHSEVSHMLDSTAPPLH